MIKKITEKEHKVLNEILMYKLRNLYNENRAFFYQLSDFLEFPVYVNNRVNYNYSYYAVSKHKLGEEVNDLFKNKKHSKFHQLANPNLLDYCYDKSELLHKANDFDKIITLPQEMKMKGEMTFYLSQKILLNENDSFNLITFPKDYGLLSNIMHEFIPKLTKTSVYWQKFQSLTKQERLIIKLIANGDSAKVISEKLFVSIHTINTHRKNIYKKLEINKIQELVKIAMILDIV